MKILKNVTAMTVISAASVISPLAYSDVGDIRWNGFVSVGGGIIVDESDTFESRGATFAGYDSDVSFKPDTLIALQASVDLSEGLSMTAQLVGNGKTDFDAKFEWAYLSYEFNDEWKVNLGKLRVPFYLYSDYLDVGYAYHWLRPPTTVYESVSFDTYEGASVLYETSMGDWDSTVQFTYGSHNSESPTGQLEISDLVGLSWGMERDWFLMRAAYYQAAVGLDSAALSSVAGGLLAAGLAGVEKDFTVNKDDDTGSFATVGMKAEYGDYVVVAEFTTVDIKDSFFAKTDQYYVSAAKRFEYITVHLTYEASEADAKSGIYNGIPDVAPLLALKAGVTGVINGQRSDVEITTVGMRYDFHSSAAFKLELSDVQQTYAGDATLLSMSVDLIF